MKKIVVSLMFLSFLFTNVDAYVLYSLEKEIKVNLLSGIGEVFLNVRISLKLSNPQNSMQLEKIRPIVIDAIINRLSSKTPEEISTEKGKYKLKKELVNIINLKIGGEIITDVYFTKFIIYRITVDDIIERIIYLEKQGCLK